MCEQIQPIPRRWLLSAFGAGTLLTFPLNSAASHVNQPVDANIVQPATPGDKTFILRAFEMRDLAQKYGDQPYGAVVVRDNKIIGQSWSRVILDHDPTAHAEMSAIRNAAHRLKNRNLSGAALYSSSRPCPMCEAAAYWSGIQQMIYGKETNKTGPPRLCR